MKETVLAGGGLLAALAASTCCVLPLALGALGVGGAVASTLTALAPFQTVFRVLAILLLGAGFWLVYGRRSGANDAAARPRLPAARATKVVLWIGAIVMGLVLSSDWWEQYTA